jgi:SAM-dependent methyltransferase
VSSARAPERAIAYAVVGAAEEDFRGAIRGAIDAGARRVADVGGGARPVLPLQRIERLGLDYLVVDASSKELARAPAGYARATASILDGAAIAALGEQHGPFDLVISRWTAEHLHSGRRFHENVYALLGPGGRAVHLFPTLYAPPFLVNRLLPSTLASGLLFRTCPDRSKRFVPYYSWCRGPTGGQLRRLESVGYRIERYNGYFGHSFYHRVPPLEAAQDAFNRLMLSHPLPALTSFALVVLRRPS